MSTAPTASTATASQEAPISKNAMTTLGYVTSIAAIVALVAEPYKRDRESRFHAVQSLLHSLAIVAAYTVLGIAFAMMSIVAGIASSLKLYLISGMLFGVMPLGWGLLGLVAMASWAYLVIMAAMGKRPKLPVLHRYAERFANGNS